MSFERLVPRSVFLLAACIALVVGGARPALAVQTSAALTVTPTNWGLLNDGDEFDVTIRAHNLSGDTPAADFPDPEAPKSATLAGPITVTLACSNTNCTGTTSGVLQFVPVGGNGCVSKNAGVSNCVSGGTNLVTINFGAMITLPAAGSVNIATIRVKVLNSKLATSVGIKATTVAGAVTACSTSAPSTCVACGAEGCTKVVFLPDIIHGCPHPCPSRIRFLSGLDSFEFHAELEVSQGFDPGNKPFTISLSNANFNPIFSYSLNAGQLIPGTDSFRFNNAAAKQNGGISVIKLGHRDNTVNSWKFDIILYDPNLEARATLANMTTTIMVGGDTFTITADWTKMPYGWFFDIP